MKNVKIKWDEAYISVDRRTISIPLDIDGKQETVDLRTDNHRFY